MNRKDVIAGLEYCTRRGFNCRENKDCPYSFESDHCHCIEHLMVDALALLKAQEPDEDWISRKRLWNEIQYYIDEAGWGDAINKVLGWCLEFIDNQEAVKWE